MRTTRTTAAAVLISGLALLVGACSGSDSEGASTTAEQKTATTTTTTTTTTTKDEDEDASSSGSTMSDDEFAMAVNDISQEIGATGGDTCGLLEVLQTMGAADLPDPSTPAQVEAAVGLVAELYTGIANSAPPEYAAEGATIAAAMVDLEAQAAAQDYDPEWFNGAEFDPFGSVEVTAALTTFATAATESCTTGTTTSIAG